MNLSEKMLVYTVQCTHTVQQQNSDAECSVFLIKYCAVEFEAVDRCKFVTPRYRVYTVLYTVNERQFDRVYKFETPRNRVHKFETT